MIGGAPPIASPMFKFALAAGVVAEWVFGPGVETALDLFHTVTQTFIATLLAWTALEALRAVYKTVMSYDGRVPEQRR
jgi:ABC-type long-subunit fatty acid transport system fused permease/ATPase subunit